MKIAITGCNGRVGKPTVMAALAQGHQVVGIDIAPPAQGQDDHHENPRFAFYLADISRFEIVLDLLKGCDAVIHLAAIPNPGDYKVEAHNCNVVLSWNVLTACAELGITRVAQASTVNVVTLGYSFTPTIQYFPLDEDHPCAPDEPYGLSKLICETQAASIVRRFPKMRVASLRLSWSVPERKTAAARDPEDTWTPKALWGYVQEDSAADAFLRAVDAHEGNDEPAKRSWSGHEAFFIVAPEIAHDGDSKALKARFWPNIPIKEGKTIEGKDGFIDCSKARDYLGWVHRDEPSKLVDGV